MTCVIPAGQRVGQNNWPDLIFLGQYAWPVTVNLSSTPSSALLLSIQELACNDSSAFNLFATLAIVPLEHVNKCIIML